MRRAALVVAIGMVALAAVLVAASSDPPSPRELARLPDDAHVSAVASFRGREFGAGAAGANAGAIWQLRGTRWQAVALRPKPAGKFNSLSPSGGWLFASGSAGEGDTAQSFVYRSPDGERWSRLDAPEGVVVQAVAVSGGVTLATGWAKQPVVTFNGDYIADLADTGHTFAVLSIPGQGPPDSISMSNLHRSTDRTSWSAQTMRDLMGWEGDLQFPLGLTDRYLYESPRV